jgi:hypothetical protein
MNNFILIITKYLKPDSYEMTTNTKNIAIFALNVVSRKLNNLKLTLTLGMFLW